jgi:hypothetical protein
MTEKNYKEGFNAGYRQLQAYALLNGFDIKEATAELWEAIGINNRNSFSQYKNGEIEPKATQAAAVEVVFNKYGVTENIWGK